MMFEAVTWVYPQGKKRAVTFSYDDGQIFDRRVVKTLNEHGMKGTFNLCSSFNMGGKNKASYIPAEEIQSLSHRKHSLILLYLLTDMRYTFVRDVSAPPQV